MRILVGILQWTVAIVSVLATLALVAWILMMIFGKDQPRTPGPLPPGAPGEEDGRPGKGI